MEGMAKVVLEKRFVKVPIAMGPSRLEVFRDCTSDTSGKSTILTSLSLLEHSIGVAEAVSSSGFSANAAAVVLGWRIARSLFPSL
jgi:hypothetical protein